MERLKRTELVAPISALYADVWGPLMNFFLLGLKLKFKWMIISPVASDSGADTRLKIMTLRMFPSLAKARGRVDDPPATARIAVAFLWLTWGSCGLTAELKGSALFEQNIRPLLKQYCLTCHSTEKHKGDLDLERFSSPSEIRKHPKVWQSVAEQLASGEMPPKDKPQLKPAERERLASWVRLTLDDLARASAGDPGPVVLRRLSNVEYTYTIRDVTGVVALDPAREFPADSAAGEGFMNTGNALVMSPSLITKYLDAGKEIASHAVLLPDGIRFSSKTTRRDRTEEILAQIREFYREFTDPRGGAKVNLQGIVFETNAGGRLPLEKYLTAVIAERDTLRAGSKTVEVVARARGLNAKYLGALFNQLNSKEPSLLLDNVRARWRTAKPADAAALAAEIGEWQKALWKFASVGHIGKLNGPKAWLEPVSPLTTKQEVRLKLPAASAGSEVTLYLVASDAGDGNEHDFVQWQEPRLVAPGRPTLLLRDVREVSRELADRGQRIFATTAKALAAAAEAGAAQGRGDVAELARKHGVDAGALGAWLDFLGIGSSGPPKIEGYFTNTIANSSGYNFIKGWGRAETPNLVANSSDQHVRIPGNMKPHSVAVHPSQKLQAVVGWRSPVAATLTVSATVQHAHPECGNGIAWFLELRRGATRQRLATGTAQGGKEVKVGPFEKIPVQPGDLVSLLIDPRDGNHSCDLTAVDLVLTSAGEGGRVWDLAADVSPDVHAGNPHADRFGHQGVWHFYTEPSGGGGQTGPVIPAGSLLARWQSAANADEKRQLAEAVQKLLTSPLAVAKDSSDAKLHEQLTSLGGPLLASVWQSTPPANAPPRAPLKMGETAWGLDPAWFGRHPNGQAREAGSLCVRAPSVIEIRLPSALVAGYEFITTGVLDKETGAEGSVQLQVLTNKPPRESGLLPSGVSETQANGPWTSNNQRIAHAAPIVVQEGSQARRRIESAFEDHRQLFPAALCYAKIVPVDEVVTLTLFYREDQQLARLMLDDTQQARLDRLWDELHYVSHDALLLVDAYEQLWQFATQDADPKAFEPLRQPINDRAAAFRQWLLDSQPRHIEALLEFAARAYRRPLGSDEGQELRDLYQKLRAQEMAHEEAIRLTLAKVFVAPAFLYRLEKAGAGAQPQPVSDWELASRLSYFLWSSQPDAELRELATAGRLHQPDVLAAQAQRMLRDARARRLATEFACQWLHLHDFDTLDEKSERHFPTFVALRGVMHEETIQFFTDLFQRDGSVLNILDADYAFLNETLARHYGIPGVTGPEWRRVEGVKQFSRGGILGLASTLSKQSGASRTSPILRGNWVAEVLLGDKLPKPPKDVPRLPEDEAAESLTVRQLTEQHSTDPRCAGCHARIDAFGFALEGFDAIGRRRTKDLGDRLIDTRAKALDGAQFEGIEGLRAYLLTQRRDAFLRQFNRKLLGFALGRAVQLSDEPLLTEMRAQLPAHEYRFGSVVAAVVRSRQFREIRGRAAVFED